MLSETCPDKVKQLIHEHENFVKKFGIYWKDRPWNEMEEKLFEDAVTTMYEWGDWISVSRIIPTRTKSKKHQVIVWLIDPLLYYSTNKPLFLLSHFLSYTRVLI